MDRNEAACPDRVAVRFWDVIGRNDIQKPQSGRVLQKSVVKSDRDGN
jgi:hypothetical protein